MSRSSEEVLLITNHVKNKKCEGSLYMMGQRMAWMPTSKDSFTVSHNYADVKIQKISPDSKEKVQLQVVMHDGGANTFQFSNPFGRDAQIKDRNDVKELLQQLLPKFKRKVNSELEEKHRMLQEDPELFQLYKDLVVSGVVTADEFWANRANPKQSESTNNLPQTIGVSAAFLADVKPQADGCNGLKYNLTTDIIDSIFRTYPAVKNKFVEYVPVKLTEQEFWTKFFQSHYFHRDRINLGNKDLFADCAKSDDKEMTQTLSEPAGDTLVDLTGMSDGALGGGYGLSSDLTANSANPANASLIKRFNQHSTMVLKACDKETVEASASATRVSNGNSKPTSNEPVAEDHPPNKKAKIREKIEYKDLEAGQRWGSGAVLKLSHTDRFLQGPTPITASQYHTSDDIISAYQASAQEMMAWKPNLTQVLGSQQAVNVLLELSPGGRLMQGSSDRLNQLVSPELHQEVKQLYNALCELLRHFWACFPVTSKFLEEKVLRMRGSLERFQMAKLQPFKDKITSHHYTSINLTGHIESMLDAAYTIFNNWQAKRMNKKS